MNKILFSEKLTNTAAFTVVSIAHMAIAVFATKTALTYGAAGFNHARHILATNGKVWKSSTYDQFTKKD